MCGIVGVLNADPFKDKDLSGFMNDGLIVGAVRGQDSTGLYQIDFPKADSKLYSYKAALVGNAFAMTKDAQAISTDSHNSFITCAHHRAATNGEKTAENAHPFYFDADDGKRLVAVHNGTLTHWNKEELGYKFNVDSAWAIWRMSKYGVESTLEELRGAFAFAIYDQRDPDSLQLVTNGARPLHFAFVGTRRSMLFASEPRMLSWLANRNNLTLKEGTIFECQPNVLYKFNAKDPTAYIGKKLNVKTWPAEQSSSYNSGYYNNSGRVRDYRSGYSVGNDARKKIESIMERVRATKKSQTEGVATVLPPDAPNQGQSGNVRDLLPSVKLVEKAERKAPAGVKGTELFFLTRDLGIPVNSEVIFSPKMYIEKDRTMVGEATVSVMMDGKATWDEFQGEIRDVPLDVWQRTRTKKDTIYTCRALGAFLSGVQRGSSPLLDTVIVCSHPEEIRATGNA